MSICESETLSGILHVFIVTMIVFGGIGVAITPFLVWMMVRNMD